MFALEEKSDGIAFKIYVQPRSSRNRIVGLHGDAPKIKLTAPPVDNAANKMCLKYLAGCLGVSNASLEIIAGQASRSKKILLRVPGHNPTTSSLRRLRARIESLLPS